MLLYNIRLIEKDDFNKNYLLLLKQLTIIEPHKISREMFDTFIDKLGINHQIYVIEELKLNIIIGTITMVIEPKLIHNMGLVCHIEDVVVDSKFRGLGLSKLLIDKSIELATKNGCYKIILDCSDLNKPIYEKRGFVNNGNLMSLYL
jgi:glucosamine-phosphate N-acetyltransferase